MTQSIRITSNSVSETIEIGKKIGRGLKGGEIFGIKGALGSGKTRLIKGIAAGAGARDEMQVNSPTFVIVNEYFGRLDMYHIDAYRLNSVSEFEMLGFDDYCYPESVVLIEWYDKVAQALEPDELIRIEMTYTGSEKRELHIENLPEYISFR